MSLDSKKSIDIKNGRWIMSDERDLGSTWDILLSPAFAEVLWGENYQDNLVKMVVMSSEDRIQYLTQFTVDYSEDEEEEKEEEEVIDDGIRGVIQISYQRIKEHSKELYEETCGSSYRELYPIIEKKSVTELVELDFFVLNNSDQKMRGNLAKYLNDIGKASFTLCPECGCDDFTHVDECSISRRSYDHLIGQNDGC